MTKRSTWVLSCFLLWSYGVFAQSGADVTVIRTGTLIDGKSDKPRANQVIVIRGNRIESVSDASSAKIPAGATEIDLSKRTVLPGLIDSHTHIFLQGEDPAKGGYDANILSQGLALRAGGAGGGGGRARGAGLHTQRAGLSAGAGRWSRDSPLCATLRPRAPDMGMSGSSRRSTWDTSPGRG